MAPESSPPTRTALSIGDESRDKLKRPFGAVAALIDNPRESAELALVERRVVRLSTLELSATGPITPAEPEVLIARQAAARVETEDGWHHMAAHRLTGAFDGDAEQRIALAALDILRENDLLKQELCAESVK